jgi:hypothetical protein
MRLRKLKVRPPNDLEEEIGKPRVKQKELSAD